jgi:hypothetical protein
VEGEKCVDTASNVAGDLGVGSPAYSRAEFNADRTQLSGAWHWPGGGYTFTITKR